MTEEIFYCECPRCSVHNKKTRELADDLEFFKNAEFVLEMSLLPKCFLNNLKAKL